MRRYGRAYSSPAHGLEDESGDLLRMFCQQALQLIGILLRAAIAAVNASVAVGRIDLRKLAQHRQINFAALLVAGNRHSSEGGAVIALATADNLVARFLPDFDLILPRQLERGFHCF